VHVINVEYDIKFHKSNNHIHKKLAQGETK